MVYYYQLSLKNPLKFISMVNLQVLKTISHLILIFVQLNIKKIFFDVDLLNNFQDFYLIDLNDSCLNYFKDSELIDLSTFSPNFDLNE
jgi:hypothetical protein